MTQAGLMPILHNLFGWSNYLFWTVVVGVFIALTALNPFDPGGRGGAASLGLFWGRLMWWVSPFWWRRWEGLDMLPDGPCIVVANHQSTVDIPCLFGLPKFVKISARTGIFHVFVMGRFLKWSGQVDTGHFMAESKLALDSGVSVVVFPEGSRSYDGQVQRFRSGAFKLAVETGYPIVPVAMEGSRGIMSKRAFFTRESAVTVVVRVLEPLQPGKDPRALSAAARHAIESALTDLRRES